MPQRILVTGLCLEFDAGQLTSGDPFEQMTQAVGMINSLIRRDTYAELGARLKIDLDEVKVGQPVEQVRRRLRISEPKISIDRSAKKVGIFNVFDLIRDFVAYEDEAAAVSQAKAWLSQYTDLTPTLVYPRITGLKVK